MKYNTMSTRKLRVYLLTSPVNDSTVDSDAPNTRRVKSPHKKIVMDSKMRKPKLWTDAVH